jgi:hypothetical protein
MVYLPCNDFGWWPGDQSLQEIINGSFLLVRVSSCCVSVSDLPIGKRGCEAGWRRGSANLQMKSTRVEG